MDGAAPMIVLDTNILIYAHRAGTAEHLPARAAIERAAASSGGWGIAQASMAEFWSQVTHPRYPGRPSTVAQASGFLQALIQGGGGRVLAPGSRFADRLRMMAVEMGVCGARIFDLQIALTALDGGARELWTHDRGFLAVRGLRVLDPL